jgi:adenosine deaminase
MYDESVSSLADHPIREMIRAGLEVTINTDDPGLFGGFNLTDELVTAVVECGITEEQVRYHIKIRYHMHMLYCWYQRLIVVVVVIDASMSASSIQCLIYINITAWSICKRVPR